MQFFLFVVFSLLLLLVFHRLVCTLYGDSVSGAAASAAHIDLAEVNIRKYFGRYGF